MLNEFVSSVANVQQADKHTHSHHHLTCVKQFVRKRRVNRKTVHKIGQEQPGFGGDLTRFSSEPVDWIGLTRLITWVRSAQCVWQPCVYQDVGSSADLQPGGFRRSTQGETDRDRERGEDRKEKKRKRSNFLSLSGCNIHPRFCVERAHNDRKLITEEEGVALICATAGCSHNTLPSAGSQI